MKGLIVEDEKSAQAILKSFLKPFGCCELADDGEEGLHKFREAFESNQPFDVIFLDIMMPKLDGQALLSRIRDFEQHNNVPVRAGVRVIMTTALGDQENVLTSHIEGCSGYLTKPIDREALFEIMRSLGYERREE